MDLLKCLLSLIFLLFGLNNVVEAREIIYSKSVPLKHLNQLKKDFEQLTPQLTKWLSQRVHFVINENENPIEHLVQLGSYSYQYPNIMPDLEAPLNFPSQEDQSSQAPGIMMTNIGTSIYYQGKVSSTLLGFSFQTKTGTMVLPISSPRAGIVQAGSDLFRNLVNERESAATSNTLFRLAVVLHEARHSDGNGKSLGFPHSICPPDHTYSGFLACDHAANGPYAQSASYLKQALLECKKNKKCSLEEVERLSFIITDLVSRILSETDWDPTPERS